MVGEEQAGSAAAGPGWLALSRRGRNSEEPWAPPVAEPIAVGKEAAG